MADNYGIGDDEIDDLYQADPDTSEHETSQTEASTEGFRRKVHVTPGNEEWNKQQRLKREKEHPTKRVENMEQAVKRFRIATSGDGFLRGKFGELPKNPAQELLDRMKDLTKAMNQFNLTGDNLNVSGSFDKGYTVSRQNPCDQQQVNQEPG